MICPWTVSASVVNDTGFKLKFYRMLVGICQVLWLFQNNCKESIQSYPGMLCFVLSVWLIWISCCNIQHVILYIDLIIMSQDTHNVRSVSFHPSGDFLLAGMLCVNLFLFCYNHSLAMTKFWVDFLNKETVWHVF